MSPDADLALRVTGLSKVYSKMELGTERAIPFHALKNINFELSKGEVLGVIGDNGSGKSTLLRILSGITKPTEGLVELNGSVASILDVGTGFHPDLSGRQNTYMRGQLLGMNRSEIDGVFDDLVAFSGVGEFIDSPVKHYSSGMFLRLAFSIIIHVKADILLLDEVMAVGDVDFSMKGAQKILEIANSGTTVILVTHNLRNVMDLCTLTALMKDGEMIDVGTPFSVISDSYLSKLAGLEGSDLKLARHDVGLNPREPELFPELKPHHFKLLSVCAYGRSDMASPSNEFNKNEEILIELKYSTASPGFHFGFALTDILSVRLIDDSPVLYDWEFTDDFVGSFAAVWTIPSDLLNDGRFFVEVFVLNEKLNIIRRFEQALEFKVHDPGRPEELSSVDRAPFSPDMKLEFKQINP